MLHAVPLSSPQRRPVPGTSVDGSVTGPMSHSVHQRAGEALACSDLDHKIALVGALRRGWLDGSLDRSPPGTLVAPDRPGRRSRPELVEPRHLRSRKLTTFEGRVAAVHAVAHIEANAIDLALDAVHRFGAAAAGGAGGVLPDAYVTDWLGVAADEARHFLALRARLADMGAAYGDLPAHDGLWAAAVRTAHDVLWRMALVPRVLEARGLDVSPGMIERFAAVGDEATAEVLRMILAEEVAHVRVGSRWFRHVCEVRGLDPEPTFLGLLEDAGVRVVPPLNTEARLAAGFSATELARLLP